MPKISQLKHNFIVNNQIQYAYKCTNLQKHPLNFLVLCKLKKTFVIFNEVLHFNLLKIKILPFFNQMTQSHRLYAIFTVNALVFFPIISVAAQKCRGLAIGQWISGAISANFSTQHIEKKLEKKKIKKYVHNIRQPNVLVTPFATDSLTAISEAAIRKVVSFGGLQFNNFHPIKPNYFLMGTGLKSEFITEFSFLFSGLIGKQNITYYNFMGQQTHLCKTYFYFLSQLIVTTKLKVRRLRTNVKKIKKQLYWKSKLLLKNSFFRKKTRHPSKQLKNFLHLYKKVTWTKVFFRFWYGFYTRYWAETRRLRFLKHKDQKKKLKSTIRRYFTSALPTPLTFKENLQKNKIKGLFLKNLKNKLRLVKLKKKLQNKLQKQTFFDPAIDEQQIT